MPLSALCHVLPSNLCAVSNFAVSEFGANWMRDVAGGKVLAVHSRRLRRC